MVGSTKIFFGDLRHLDGVLLLNRAWQGLGAWQSLLGLLGVNCLMIFFVMHCWGFQEIFYFFVVSAFFGCLALFIVKYGYLQLLHLLDADKITGKSKMVLGSVDIMIIAICLIVSVCIINASSSLIFNLIFTLLSYFLIKFLLFGSLAAEFLFFMFPLWQLPILGTIKGFKCIGVIINGIFFLIYVGVMVSSLCLHINGSIVEGFSGLFNEDELITQYDLVSFMSPGIGSLLDDIKVKGLKTKTGPSSSLLILVPGESSEDPNGIDIIKMFMQFAHKINTRYLKTVWIPSNLNVLTALIQFMRGFNTRCSEVFGILFYKDLLNITENAGFDIFAVSHKELKLCDRIRSQTLVPYGKIKSNMYLSWSWNTVPSHRGGSKLGKEIVVPILGVKHIKIIKDVDLQPDILWYYISMPIVGGNIIRYFNFHVNFTDLWGKTEILPYKEFSPQAVKYHLGLIPDNGFEDAKDSLPIFRQLFPWMVSTLKGHFENDTNTLPHVLSLGEVEVSLQYNETLVNNVRLLYTHGKPFVETLLGAGVRTDIVLGDCRYFYYCVIDTVGNHLVVPSLQKVGVNTDGLRVWLSDYVSNYDPNNNAWLTWQALRISSGIHPVGKDCMWLEVGTTFRLHLNKKGLKHVDVSTILDVVTARKRKRKRNCLLLMLQLDFPIYLRHSRIGDISAFVTFNLHRPGWPAFGVRLRI